MRGPTDGRPNLSNGFQSSGYAGGSAVPGSYRTPERNGTPEPEPELNRNGTGTELPEPCGLAIFPRKTFAESHRFSERPGIQHTSG